MAYITACTTVQAVIRPKIQAINIAYTNMDQLVQSYGDRQGAGAIFQVDQSGSTYPQRRPTRYESGRGQLSTQSRL